jgi:hypothetical protein
MLLVVGGSSAGVLWVQAATGTPIVQYGPTLLSSATSSAKEPAVSSSANGEYVYVAWTQEGGGIYSTVSRNGGSSWSKPLKISQKGGTAQFPVTDTGDGYQSPNAGDVYVAWAQTVSGTLQIFVASSTNNGVSFSTKQVSKGGGITPALASSGSDVYVTWYQNTPCPATALNPLNVTTGLGQTGCIYVDSSTNNGSTWSSPVELNPSSNGEAQIVATGNYAYMAADGQYFASFGVTKSNWNGSGTTLTGWTEPLNVYGIYSYDPSSPGTNCNSFPSPSGCLVSFGREPWIAASGVNVYMTWEARNLSSSTALYSDYGITSSDGGVSFYPGTCNAITCPGSKLAAFPPNITSPAQQAIFSVSKQAPDTWEPENVAMGSMAFLTIHSLHNQGVYVSSTANGGGSWSTPVEVNSALKGTSAFPHIFSSDGINVWVMWGQQITKGSSVWNAYISYSGNEGSSWSAPLDISNNAAGVAAGNQDVTLFWVSSIGTTCFAVWTYTNGGASEVMFASITA